MRRNLKHRTVFEIRKGKYISQEPEMKKLSKVVRDMVEEGKARTKRYLKDQEQQ